MSESGEPVITITGITGYLGSRVLYTFLQRGGCKVRGTLRNKKKTQVLEEAFGDLWKNVELIEADLNDEASMMKACEGSDIVVHTASPFFMESPKDVQKDLIDPAVNGTLSVLKGCVQHKVKRCVFTASMVTVMMQTSENLKKVTENMTEDIFSDPKACDPYSLSKLKAEQAAWEYLEKLPEEDKFELVSIHPGLIMGPTFTKGAFFESGHIMGDIMMNKGMLPPMQFPFSDVRDIAKAHMEACFKDGVNKKRIFVA